MTGPNYFSYRGLVHLDHPNGNDTLCGDALEGDGEHTTAMKVVPQRIGCDSCIRIIESAKLVPNKFFRNRKKRGFNG